MCYSYYTYPSYKLQLRWSGWVSYCRICICVNSRMRRDGVIRIRTRIIIMCSIRDRICIRNSGRIRTIDIMRM